MEITVDGERWEAASEPLYTIVMADDGIEYIRVASGWEPYQDVEFVEPLPELYESESDTEENSAPKKKRITAYNIFMKITLKKISKNHPDMDCKDGMKLAAELWKDAKNQKSYKVRM